MLLIYSNINQLDVSLLVHVFSNIGTLIQINTEMHSTTEFYLGNNFTWGSWLKKLHTFYQEFTSKVITGNSQRILKPLKSVILC